MNIKKVSSWTLGFSIKVVVLLILVSVLYAACSKAFEFGSAIFAEEGVAAVGEGEEFIVSIPTGSNSKEVGSILYDKGIIKNINIFAIQMMLYEGEINEGVYSFSTEDSPEVIIEKLTEGLTVEKEISGEE